MMDFCQVFAGLFFIILATDKEKYKTNLYAKTVITWR
jgi:hypothetical protein